MTDTDTPQAETDYQPLSGAERMRLHRQRKREGKTLIQIEIFDREIEAFREMGLLPSDRPIDKEDITDALYKFLDRHLRKLP